MEHDSRTDMLFSKADAHCSLPLSLTCPEHLGSHRVHSWWLMRFLYQHPFHKRGARSWGERKPDSTHLPESLFKGHPDGSS